MKSCKHCGGAVEEDGYATRMADGGEIDEGFELEQRQAVEHANTEQLEDTEMHRDDALVDAIKSQRFEPLSQPGPGAKPEGDLVSDEIKKRKEQRYGFMKRKAG
jgi:hypothetical protein